MRSVFRSGLGVRKLPSLAALVFIMGVLLVFSFSTWRLYRDLELSKEQDLQSRLLSVARTIGHQLEGNPPFILMWLENLTEEAEQQSLADYMLTPQYPALVEWLVEIQQLNRLAQIVLMTPRGNVIADSKNEIIPGEPYVFWEVDRLAREEAVDRRESWSPFYRVRGVPYKRVYRTIMTESGMLAILQVSASPDYVGQLEQLRRKVTFQWLLGTALLLLIGLSIFRLFSHVVRMENQAMHSARVEAMGALAGGVAHELRNPLAIIRALAEEVIAEQPPGSRVAENAKDILSETDRLNEMVSHFLSLSRAPRTAATRPLDLVTEISRVVQLMRKGSGARVRFVSELPDTPLLVRSTEQAIRQVLLNLLLNAGEAVQDSGGEVRVTLRERRGSAEIHVIDNGAGIAPRDLPRVFEPFYTSKQMGTGLGLSITRGIIENLGGTITISSEPGRGTDVCVIFPLSRESSEQEEIHG
jgi:signal transduction histidine kinase